MLVIFVVGIIAALAMPNLLVQDEKQRLRESAEGLLRLMQLQEEEAILTGGQRGLRLYRRDRSAASAVSYQWLSWSSDSGLWLADTDQARQLEGALQGVFDFELLIDGQPVPPAEEPVVSSTATASQDAEKPLTPQIVIYSSGDVTEFELNLQGPEGQLSATLLGGFDGLSMRDDDLAATRN